MNMYITYIYIYIYVYKYVYIYIESPALMGRALMGPPWPLWARPLWAPLGSLPDFT